MLTCWLTWLTSAAWWQLELFPLLFSMPTWSPQRPISPFVDQGEGLDDYRLESNRGLGLMLS